MTYDTQIASLLSARICHDLVSPVGAVVNGVGLVQEIAGPGLAQELSMIGQSAGRASSMLQFYRIAFGSGDDDGSDVSRSLIETHASQLIVSSKISFDLSGADGAPMSRREGKIFCLMILCGRALVGLRGHVQATLTPPAPQRMRVAVQATSSLSNPGFLDILNSSVPAKDVPPRAIEFLLLKAAAAEAGTNLDVTATDSDAGIALI